MSARSRLIHFAVVAVVVAALSATTTVVHRQTDDRVLIAYWWLGMLVIVACLVAFAVGRRFTRRPIARGRVLCIVPAYNEDRGALRTCVAALANQTVPMDIVVIDDGSAEPVVPPRSQSNIRWLRQPNTGKRGAQVTVLRREPRGKYQFVLTVDSDSAPYPDAVEHLLRAMSNPKVQAATGMIYIRNYRDSLVARAADIDIGTSCVMMRASRSMLGALETTSGALALYRADLLYDHLDAYAVECGTGDDRWLALRALERGEVVGVAEAGVETDMPDTLKGTYKQRLRWARSWWWMLPYVFRNLSFKQLISPTYGMMQLVVAPLLVGAAGYGTVVNADRYSGHVGALAVYLTAYAVVRCGLSALYLVGRPNMPAGQKWLSFVIGTPTAVLLNMFWLTPIRYWALFKLRDNRWRTREAKTNMPTGFVSPHRADVRMAETVILVGGLAGQARAAVAGQRSGSCLELPVAGSSPCRGFDGRPVFVAPNHRIPGQRDERAAWSRTRGVRSDTPHRRAVGGARSSGGGTMGMPQRGQRRDVHQRGQRRDAHPLAGGLLPTRRGDMGFDRRRPNEALEETVQLRRVIDDPSCTVELWARGQRRRPR